MSDSCEWLDTQTKSELAGSPPQKLAPPAEAGYSIVLLRLGYDLQRVDRVLERFVSAPRTLGREYPFVVRSGLSETDALEIQFELICVDSISVFIEDQVLENASQDYLNDLYETLLQSSEFQPIRVHIASVPSDNDGMRFMEQFFGGRQLPIEQVVARKKARILEHWANRIGAEVECQETMA